MLSERGGCLIPCSGRSRPSFQMALSHGPALQPCWSSERRYLAHVETPSHIPLPGLGSCVFISLRSPCIFLTPTLGAIHPSIAYPSLYD